LGRLEIGLALVRSFGTASATPPLFTSLDHTFIAGSYRYQCCTTKAHRTVIFAIAQFSCLAIDVIWRNCVGWTCLQCFDAVGWAAGRASGL